MEKENKIIGKYELDAEARQRLEEKVKENRAKAIRQRRAESAALPYYNPAHDPSPNKC